MVLHRMGHRNKSLTLVLGELTFCGELGGRILWDSVIMQADAVGRGAGGRTPGLLVQAFSAALVLSQVS